MSNLVRPSVLAAVLLTTQTFALPSESTVRLSDNELRLIGHWVEASTEAHSGWHDFLILDPNGRFSVLIVSAHGGSHAEHLTGHGHFSATSSMLVLFLEEDGGRVIREEPLSYVLDGGILRTTTGRGFVDIFVRSKP